MSEVLQYLTVPEAAVALGITAEWLRRLVSAGRMPISGRTAKGRVIFERDAIERERARREAK
jgi:excisionase family DNA binding protein